MNKIKIVLLSLIFNTLRLYSQQCEFDLRDSITQLEIRNFGLSHFDHNIDAQDLLSNQSVLFYCNKRIDDTHSSIILIYNFRYKIFRNSMLMRDGVNEGSSYLNTDLGKGIYDAEIGDSIVFCNFNTDIGRLRNIKLIDVGYKITKNSIFKYDSIESKGAKKITTTQSWNEIFDLYPSDGGCDCAHYVRNPEYDSLKSKVFYRHTLARFVLEKDSKINKYNRSTKVDYDFSYVYYIRNNTITIFDYIGNKEYSLNDWELFGEKELVNLKK